MTRRGSFLRLDPRAEVQRRGLRVRAARGLHTQTINGTIYYEYAGVDYQPKMVDGGTAYVVVRV
jgi:hypothetical protein